jgi:membrane protease YdiL (CAAX protease family)
VLAWRVISPSLEEELLYRGGIQSKLERAINPRASWFITGIFFGLAHIPTDFFGPIWFYYGQNIFTSTSFFFTQITFGWLIGIFFTRTRSLYPCIVGHYLFDFLPDIIAHLV